MRIPKLLIAAAVGGLALAGGATARANTIQLNYDPGASNPASGTYVYNADLLSGSELLAGNTDPGSRVIFFDFPGLTSATFAPTGLTGGWTDAVTVEAVTNPSLYNPSGFTPLIHIDSPALNVRIEFTGGTSDLDGAVTLGQLTLTSSVTGEVANGVDNVLSIDHKSDAGIVDDASAQRTSTSSPIPAPAPASALGGLGLLGLLAGGRIMRRRVTA